MCYRCLYKYSFWSGVGTIAVNKVSVIYSKCCFIYPLIIFNLLLKIPFLVFVELSFIFLVSQYPLLMRLTLPSFSTCICFHLLEPTVGWYLFPFPCHHNIGRALECEGLMFPHLLNFFLMFNWVMASLGPTSASGFSTSTASWLFEVVSVHPLLYFSQIIIWTILGQNQVLPLWFPFFGLWLLILVLLLPLQSYMLESLLELLLRVATFLWRLLIFVPMCHP